MGERGIEYPDILFVEGINSEGYGMIAKAVMQDRRLTVAAKAIYSYFCSFAGKGRSAFPGAKKICYDLNFGSQDTMRKHRDLLIVCGYLKCRQEKDNNGRFKRNIYTLIDKPVPMIDTSEMIDGKINGKFVKLSEIKAEVQNTDTQFYGNGKTPLRRNWVYKNNSNNKNNSYIKNNNNTPLTSGGKETRPEAGVVVKLDNLFFEVTGRRKKSLFMKLLKKYEPDEILKQLEYLKKYSENNIVENPEGFLIEALKESWEIHKLDRSSLRNKKVIEETRKLIRSYTENERAGPNRGPEIIKNMYPWIGRGKSIVEKNRDGPKKGGDNSEDPACNGN